MHAGQYRVVQADFWVSELMRSLLQGMGNLGEHCLQAAQHDLGNRPQAAQSTKIERVILHMATVCMPKIIRALESPNAAVSTAANSCPEPQQGRCLDQATPQVSRVLAVTVSKHSVIPVASLSQWKIKQPGCGRKNKPEASAKSLWLAPTVVCLTVSLST